MNNRTTSTTEQHERDDGEEMPIGLPRRRKTTLADSIGPHSFDNEKDLMADLMSPRSFDEPTFYGGGLNAIRDHHRLRSDYNSPSATGDSFSTVALTFYKLLFDYTLQSE